MTLAKWKKTLKPGSTVWLAMVSLDRWPGSNLYSTYENQVIQASIVGHKTEDCSECKRPLKESPVEVFKNGYGDILLQLKTGEVEEWSAEDIFKTRGEAVNRILNFTEQKIAHYRLVIRNKKHDIRTAEQKLIHTERLLEKLKVDLKKKPKAPKKRNVKLKSKHVTEKETE